jgi:hypothetical protein
MSETQSAQKESTTVNLLDLPVTNENEALNVMVGFLGLAQKRGCFAINEAAKIYECVKLFQKPALNTGSN